MGILFNWLDKKALQAFNREMENNAKLSVPCRIIVANMIEERYDRTLEIMERKNRSETLEHLHLEGEQAGERYLRLLKFTSKNPLFICQVAEASLSQALYHCLQCEKSENVLYASNQIMEYIFTFKVQRFAYEEEIQAILEGGG